MKLKKLWITRKQSILDLTSEASCSRRLELLVCVNDFSAIVMWLSWPCVRTDVCDVKQQGAGPGGLALQQQFKDSMQTSLLILIYTCGQKKISIAVQNDKMASKWQNFHLWVNYRLNYFVIKSDILRTVVCTVANILQLLHTIMIFELDHGNYYYQYYGSFLLMYWMCTNTRWQYWQHQCFEAGFKLCETINFTTYP